jgi:hypothetical protein
MLIRRDPHASIQDDGMINVKFAQWQDDGTGRSVYRFFNVNGWQVEPKTGKIIDPEYVSPEEAERRLAEKAKAEAEKKMLEAQASGKPSNFAWADVKEPELMLSDRLNIKDPAQKGYLEAEDIQAELKKIGVRYHWNAGREKLLKLLREELGLGVES